MIGDENGFTLVIWKPEGLQIHWRATNDELQECAIDLGLYSDDGTVQSDDKWLVFRGQMQDSSRTI